MRTILTVSCLTVILAACGGSEEPAKQATSVETATVTTPAETEATTLPSAVPEDDVADPEIQARLAALPAPYNDANLDRGQKIFKQCSTCHLTEKGKGNRVGPNLYGIFGRHTAMAEGFSYSDAMKEADFSWTPDHLEEWLTNPREFMPGNRMSFAGVRKPDDRRDVIAYLLIETSDAE